MIDIFFAATADSVADSDLVRKLIQLIAYAAPYFLIPWTFKAGMGVFGALTGAVNDRSRGGFDRLRKARQNKRAATWQRARNFERFKAPGLRKLNTAIGAGANPRSMLGGKTGVLAAREGGRLAQAAADLENDKIFQAHKNDDKFLAALANRQLATDNLKSAQAKLTEARASGDQDKINAAQADVDARTYGLTAAGRVASKNMRSTQAAAFDAWTKTGYEVSAGQKGYEEIRSTAEKISGGDPGVMSSMMNQAQYNLKGALRPDLGGLNNGAVGTRETIKSGIRKLNNYGRGQGKTELYHGGAEAWLGVSSADEAFGPKLGQIMASGGEQQLKDVAEWHGMLRADYQGATDGNKLEIMKQIEAIESARVGGTPEERETFAKKLAENNASARTYVDRSELDK